MNQVKTYSIERGHMMPKFNLPPGGTFRSTAEAEKWFAGNNKVTTRLKRAVKGFFTGNFFLAQDNPGVKQFLSRFLEDKPMFIPWDTTRAINEGFKKSSYVYACVMRIAKAASSLPWTMKRKKRDDTFEVVPDHPVSTLLNNPNPHMSRLDVWEKNSINLLLGGNFLIHKVRGGIDNQIGPVVELWPLSPADTRPIPSVERFISGYEFRRGQALPMKIDAMEIIHGWFCDPANPYWGMSPLQAGARIVDTDLEATNWNMKSFQNRARPSGAFSYPDDISDEQFKQAKAQIEKNHEGSDNAFKPFILGAGGKWTQISQSAVDMDFIEGRKMSINEICSIFNVPPPLVGLFDDATLANIETARKIFWIDTIIPFMDDIRGALNRGLLPDFNLSPQEWFIDYDVSAVAILQREKEAAIEATSKLWAMGVPFNVAAKFTRLGIGDILGGEIGWIPGGLLPAVGIAAPESLDDE